MSSPDSVGGTGGGGDQKGQIVKQNAFPIDLASKIALVKPTDGKGATVQTHQFRNLTQQPMRVVVPGGTVQGSTTAQIIQTHMMQPAMLKQVDALGRTQIMALPSRTMAQTSITVSRPLTPNTFMPRGISTVTNISGPRGTIRAHTPPISTVTNISSGFVRSTVPPRTPSPAGTVIPTATTWMAGSQPVQLIRASIGHSPRTRIVSQGIPAATASSNSGITTISANIVSSQAVSQSQTQQATIQAVSSGTTVTAGNISGQPQAFVATLATVLPPRPQTATLVYSNVNNPQQFGTTATGQRLVTAPLSGQRQIRPIQISNRLPTTGVRVSTGNISIRGPNIPVLAPSSVLSSLPAGASTTVTASNLTAVTGLPAARIIQVQQQQSGGTAQVLSAGRISGNLMTLHPLVMNATAASGSAVRGAAATAKPSLTITHVNKVATPTSQGNVQLTTTNLPQGATITATVPSSVGLSHQSQQHTPTSTPIGIVMGTNSSQPGSGQHQQIAQIVNLNQTGVNVGHGHQIQIIGSQNTQQGSSTVVPLTITSRAANTSLTGTTITTLPASVATNLSHIVRGNVSIVTSIAGGTVANNSAVTGLPVAKVLPQQQQQEQHQIKKVMTEQGILKATTDAMYFTSKSGESIKTSAPSYSNIGNISATVSNTESLADYQQSQQAEQEQQQKQQIQQGISSDSVVSVSALSAGQNVFIHSRSPSSTTLSNATNVVNLTNPQGGSIISAPPGTYYMSAAAVSSASGTPAGGPIVVSTVTTNSTPIITTSCTTSLSASYVPQAGSFAVVPASNRTSNNATLVSTAAIQNAQPIPVRFNPQLIVDGGTQTVQGGAIISIHQQQQQQQQNQHQTIQGQHKQQQMIVPMPSAKVVVSASRAPSVVSSALRNSSDSFVTTATIPIKSAVKNLNPALMAMESETSHQHIPRPSTPNSRPGSTDGSTTVSATSSPGIDQQEQEELNALRAFHQSTRNIADSLQYKNVDLYNHSQRINAQLQHLQTNTDSHYSQITHSSHMLAYQQPHHHLQHETSAQMNYTNNNNNNFNDDLTPRKRARKQQLGDNLVTPTKRYQVSTSINQQPGDQTYNIFTGSMSMFPNVAMNANALAHKNANIYPVKNNKDKPVDFYIKKPRSCSLLNSYKQSWKPTNNHFQRYSDVKPREERRPTVVDLANQAHVLQKVNGWKIYHLTSQMEDLTELESQVYDKLASMLQCMEAHNQNSDVDRVNDLIKGNMQRSKIVSDSINEARTQILKVFDHKSHVSDIIHRCASKRNFKKREKS